MTRAPYQQTERMTERQTIEMILEMTDAMRRVESKAGSAMLVPKPGHEKSLDDWTQCSEWLREKIRELEARRRGS